MNVKLTPHAEELLAAMRDRHQEPVERIVEHALEVLMREDRVEAYEARPDVTQPEAVQEMLDFIKQNRVPLGPGLSVKDLIHEGHRV